MLKGFYKGTYTPKKGKRVVLGILDDNLQCYDDVKSVCRAMNTAQDWRFGVVKSADWTGMREIRYPMYSLNRDI